MSTEISAQTIPSTTGISGTDENFLLPVFLKLETLRVLLVGGGPVALEKLTTILSNSPHTNVHVVAKEINDAIQQLSAVHSSIRLSERPYEFTDIEEADLVIAAVNDTMLAQRIHDDAREKGILINSADKPGLCDFYLGSVVKKGNLKIGISTNGQSPTIAKRLKEILQRDIPDDINELLGNMHQLRNLLPGDFAQKVQKLNTITRSMVEKEKSNKWRKIAMNSLAVFAIMLIGHFIFSYLPLKEIGTGAVDLYHALDKNFGWMVLAGFIAQLVDGALGMGYGITSTTMLLSTGTNPAAISGSIHTAEMFASGTSGYSHYKFGNVNKKLFKVLVIPGIIGAVGGALLLTWLGEKYAGYVKPILAVYTLLLGIRILITAFKPLKKPGKFRQYGALAGAGGFLDSFGGGGWGPIVTTTLIAKGRSPRFVIGTVSITEFFVTLASAFTFFTVIGLTHWQVILALIIGGITAAPLAARLAGKLPRKTALVLVALLVIVWSVRIIVKLL